jgi:hypothetical protein
MRSAASTCVLRKLEQRAQFDRRFRRYRTGGAYRSREAAQLRQILDRLRHDVHAGIHHGVAVGIWIEGEAGGVGRDAEVVQQVDDQIGMPAEVLGAA